MIFLSKKGIIQQNHQIRDEASGFDINAAEIKEN